MKKSKLTTGRELVRKRWATANAEYRHEVGLKLAEARAAKREGRLPESDVRRLASAFVWDAPLDLSLDDYVKIIRRVKKAENPRTAIEAIDNAWLSTRDEKLAFPQVAVEKIQPVHMATAREIAELIRNFEEHAKVLQAWFDSPEGQKAFARFKRLWSKEPKSA